MKKEFNTNESLLKGTIVGNERGYAFLVPDDGGEDYFISHSDLCGALHGDKVTAVKKDLTGRRTTARVKTITERGIKKLVGTYSKARSGGFVIPDDRKYFCDIYVPYSSSKKAKTGDKVVCNILFYPKNDNPEGEITEILGRQFEIKAEVKSIAVANGIDDEFPSDVISEAEEVAREKTDLSDRTDFTEDTVVTIDGGSAKDFDDAICVKKVGDIYRLYVHIADVTNFVKKGKAIDTEAFKRATSVYFPESVIPMLPERLCNDVCSLMPNKERLTLSCVMDIDKTGKVVDNRIVKGIIRSKARMTYTEVASVLEGDKALKEKYGEIADMLFQAEKLCDILIKKRSKRGSIDLDVKEAEITVKRGRINVEPAVRNKAHRLIEEFMIVANETVAEYAYYIGINSIYRIHEKPSEDKIKALTDFLSGLGLPQRWHADNVYPKDFQTLLTKLEEEKSPVATLVNKVVLRSMQKAKYSTENAGHFGLSSKCYCHFTSPIRRYPDLCVHRTIKAFLSGKAEGLNKELLQASAEQSNIREKCAETAERAVDDFYKVMYISNFVGETFEGIVSGVQNFGIFVELPSTVEGIVKVETMKGRHYVYDEKNFTLSNGERKYSLGQKVKIVVAGVDYGGRRAEFLLAEDVFLAKKKRK